MNIENNIDDNIDDLSDEMNIEDIEDIEEDEILDIDIEEEDVDIIEDVKISKHKEVGKHALKYDSIFKGKKDDGDIDEYIIESNSRNNSYEPDASSSYSFERESPIEYARLNTLRKELYEIIVNVIKLNIKNSRRKPSRVDFNKHYSTIVSSLEMDIYSHSEVFIEFAYYFSDNIENMFKLLDKKWGGKIAMELAKKGNIKGAKNLEDIDFC